MRGVDLALFLHLSISLMVPLGVTGGNSGLTLSVDSSMGNVSPETRCLAEKELKSVLRSLSVGGPEAERAQELLREESKTLPICKKQVVTAVVSAMDKPNLDFERDRTTYNLWFYGSQLLGDLKASEGLDLLISHLDSSSGLFSSTMDQQPALDGVIRMGRMAIRRLTGVLRTSPDRNMRRYAIYCLSFIGGASAIGALRRVLNSEPDFCVRALIRTSIENLNNKQHRLRDQVKWLSVFFESEKPCPRPANSNR